MDNLAPLAPYAFPDAASRGRRHPEPAHPFRTPFQRDRERIVHSSAFRRMTGKTQVLVASVNDHHRTRLTHTLEVTQVARTVARRLRLNEDLVEVIALAHDIGHPPFGHAGEKALHLCLADCGGFNHNRNGLRRVDLLEERYPEFPGLNLSFEVREAFIRHAGPVVAASEPEFASCGAVLLEAQVVDEVDSIAYDTHDIDDALGLGFVTLENLKGLSLWQRASDTVAQRHAALPQDAFRTAVVRELLAAQVNDLLSESARRIADANLRSIDDVRAATQPLIGCSETGREAKRELEQFLHEHVYRNHKVLRMTARGKRILKALFEEYRQAPELLPERHLRRWSEASRLVGPARFPALPGRIPEPSLEIVIVDYLSGMTDRYAQQEYHRLFQPSADL